MSVISIVAIPLGGIIELAFTVRWCSKRNRNPTAVTAARQRCPWSPRVRSVTAVGCYSLRDADSHAGVGRASVRAPRLYPPLEVGVS